MSNKKILSMFCLFLMLILITRPAGAIEIYKTSCTKSNIETPQDALLYKQHIMRIQKNRALVYNALDLSDEQVKSIEECAVKYTPVYETKFNELIKESYTLKALIAANMESGEIKQQKKIVKNIRKDIENIFKEEDKAFKKCLTREQRSKYSMIKKLERKDFKEAKHPKDYYKSNPRMRPFGNPKPCTDNSETKQLK